MRPRRRHRAAKHRAKLRAHNRKAQQIRSSLAYRLGLYSPRLFDRLNLHAQRIAGRELMRRKRLPEAPTGPACEFRTLPPVKHPGGWAYSKEIVLANSLEVDKTLMADVAASMQNTIDAMSMGVLFNPEAVAYTPTGRYDDQPDAWNSLEGVKSAIRSIRAEQQRQRDVLLGAWGVPPAFLLPTEQPKESFDRYLLNQMAWKVRFSFAVRREQFVSMWIDELSTVGGYTKREVLRVATGLLCIDTAERIGMGAWAVRCAEEIAREARG